MKALILAGGLGTRLRPLTDHQPKSLLPICNRPFLEHQVRLLAQHGITEATLLTGYLAEPFDEFARRALGFGVRVTVSTEEKPLDTAGAVRRLLDDLDGTTIVFNGDVLTDLDLSAELELHRANDAQITLALTYVEDSDAFGVVPLDDDGRVTEFKQNAKAGAPQPGDWINAGMYIIEPEALEGIPADTPWSFETQLFPSLLAAGARVFGYRSDAYWIDIGTPQRYLQVHFDILTGKARAAVDGRMMANEVTLPDGTRVIGPCLLSHAAVEPGATVGPLVSMGARVHIGPRAVVSRSVLHEEADIGEGAIVRDAIIGAGATVDPGEECVGVVRA